MTESLINSIKKYFIKPIPTPHVEEEFHRDDRVIIEILDNMEEMVYQIDSNFIIKWANKSVLERHPASLGRKCYEAFSHQQGICQDCFCQKAIISGSIVKGIKINNSFTIDEGIHYVESISFPVNKNPSIVTLLQLLKDIFAVATAPVKIVCCSTGTSQVPAAERSVKDLSIEIFSV